MDSSQRRHRNGVSGLVLGIGAIAAGVIVIHEEGNSADGSIFFWLLPVAAIGTAAGLVSAIRGRAWPSAALNFVVLACALYLLIALATYPGD
jgi:hypothetical protein